MGFAARLLNDQKQRTFWALLLLTLLIMAIMNAVGLPLITPAAPAGIVSFELAGSMPQTQAILDSWDGRARLYAAFGLGLDYVFMLAYGALFALACRNAGARLRLGRWPLAGLGSLLSRAMWLAAALDALENFALAAILLEALADPWPAIAAVSATLKFGLLLLGLAYSLYGLLMGYVRPK